MPFVFSATVQATDDNGQPKITEFRCDVSVPTTGKVLSGLTSDIPHSTTKTLFDLEEPTQGGILESFVGLALKVEAGGDADVELELTAPEDDSEGDRVQYQRVRAGGLFVLTDGRGRSDPTDADFGGEVVHFTKLRVRNLSESKPATVRWAIVG